MIGRQNYRIVCLNGDTTEELNLNANTIIQIGTTLNMSLDSKANSTSQTNQFG
jgi:hypothetical protein